MYDLRRVPVFKLAYCDALMSLYLHFRPSLYYFLAPDVLQRSKCVRLRKLRRSMLPDVLRICEPQHSPDKLEKGLLSQHAWRDVPKSSSHSSPPME